MAVALNDSARQLVDGKNFGVVATLNADGSPHTSVVWVTRDGDRVLFSTHSGRLKARNIARDARVSITILDRDDPYRTVDIRGRAELAEDEGRVVQRAVNYKYMGGDPPPDPDGVVRLVVRVTPERIVEFPG
jgi:PPOX class probable F420-dependent enzyme